MVLQHIANSTGLLIKRPAPFDADRLCGRNLNVVDVVPIPDRLKDPITKTEDENILNSLLAKIVIDAKDRGFREDGM